MFYDKLKFCISPANNALVPSDAGSPCRSAPIRH
jgi:hypothetical protein